MRTYTLSAIACGLLAIAPWISAMEFPSSSVALWNASEEVHFRLNIPLITPLSGKGPIFVQIVAPSSYKWIALGQGSLTGNASIFLIYPRPSGSNATLSSRISRMAYYNQKCSDYISDVALLEGSGIFGDTVIANMECAEWTYGTMDFKDNSTQWFWAFDSTSAQTNGNDICAQLSLPDAVQSFEWNISDAKGGNGPNPFGDLKPTALPSLPTISRRNDHHHKHDYDPYHDHDPYHNKNHHFHSSSSDSDSDSDSGHGKKKILIAHGVIASFTFVILFPLGAIAVRLFSSSLIAWLHGAFQIFASLAYFAAFALGIYLATNKHLFHHYHPIIGIVIFILILLQPFLGITNHIGFKRHSHRTLWSYVHIWLGRFLIILGIVNGAFGLVLARKAKIGVLIAYCIVAALVLFVWFMALLCCRRKRRRKTKRSKRARRRWYRAR